jgi:phosphoribosylformylglycinamidine synthase
VSWKICQQRDNPACADAEHACAGAMADPGLHIYMPNEALARIEHTKTLSNQERFRRPAF